MAIAFRSKSENKGGSGSSIVLTKPSGTVSGDLLIALVQIQNVANTVNSVPSGWSLIDTQNTGPDSYDNHTALYYKVAGGSEPADYTWGFSGSNNVGGVMGCWSGCASSSPIGGTAKAQDTNFDTTEAAPSVTVSGTGSWVLAVLAWEGSSNYSSGPGSYTRRDSDNGTPSFADSNGTTGPGSVSPGTWTLSLGKRKALYSIEMKVLPSSAWPLLHMKNEVYNTMNTQTR